MSLLLDKLFTLSTYAYASVDNNKIKFISNDYEVEIDMNISNEDLRNLSNKGISGVEFLKKAKDKGYSEDEAILVLKKLLNIDIIRQFSPYKLCLDFHKRTSFEYIPPGVRTSSAKKSVESNNYEIKLSKPLCLDVTLQRSLLKRRSVRTFQKKALSEQHLSTLLWSMYGEINGKRVVASAGGSYPIRIYVFCLNVSNIERGAYEYYPKAHALKLIKSELEIERYLVTRHINYEDSGVLIILGGNIEYICDRYSDRGYRYLLVEAGLVAQNSELAVSSLNLSSVLIGGLKDKEISETLNLNENNIIIIGMVVGHGI